MNALVIGAGRMGRRHMKTVQHLGWTLSGVLDVSKEALAVAAAECGLPETALFTGLDEALGKSRPDCVIVSTTTDTHCHFTCEAARSGAKYILCEKPMAGSIADCDRMTDTCLHHGVRLGINHHLRYNELHQSVKALLDSEALGGLTSMTVVGGDVGMAMIGTHMFDLFRFMTGENPSEVAAWLTKSATPNPRGAHFDDRSGSIRLENASGKRFYMEAGEDQGHGVSVVYGARRGQITEDLLGGSVRVIRRQDCDIALATSRYATKPVETTAQYSTGDSVSGTSSVLRGLVAGACYPTAEDGRMAVAALVAGYVSNENGHRNIRLDDPAVSAPLSFPWP